jgi:hypothetical protein
MGGLHMSMSCAYRCLRHRAANRLDHVTLTPGATALAVSDFSVINYEEAKFVITLKDGRKYTVTITPENDSS